MNFELSEDQALFVKGVRDFARGEIVPRAAAMDREGHMSEDLVKMLREQGFFGLAIPEQYGGLGVSTLTYGLVMSELSAADAGVAIMVGVHNSVGSYPLLQFGSDELKQRVLPAMAGGELGCFCLTEPGAGSDAGNLATRAEKSGGGYRLTGEKIWVTNGAQARFFVVMARTGEPGPRGISAFLLERDTPGLSIGAKEQKMGLRSSDTVSVVLDGAVVPAAQMLGNEGDGFKIAMQALDGGRIGVAYQSIGVARACLEAATGYAQEREAFGAPLAQIPAIQDKLAQMATELEAASMLAAKAATYKDQGRPFTKLAAMAKYYASEMAGRVADEAVQIYGGFGYSRDYAVERYYRDVRVLRIYEGTSEIQKLVIARRHLDGE